MEPENTGNHIEKESTISFFNYIIILNLNDTIMEKEPVRVVDTISMRWNQKTLGTT